MYKLVSNSQEFMEIKYGKIQKEKGDPGMAIIIINKNGIGNKSIINRALITLLLIVIA